MSRLLAYESVPRNAAILARLAPVSLVEVRSLMQLKRAIENQPAAIVALEVTQPRNLPAVANLIHWMKRKVSHTAVIAMPLETIPGANPWLYEAGADMIFESMLDREMARKLINRAVAADLRQENSSENDSLRDRVVASMPWRRFAS